MVYVLLKAVPASKGGLEIHVPKDPAQCNAVKQDPVLTVNVSVTSIIRVNTVSFVNA